MTSHHITSHVANHHINSPQVTSEPTTLLHQNTSPQQTPTLFESSQNKGSINQGCHKRFYRHMFFWFIFTLPFWNFRHRLVRYYWYIYIYILSAQHTWPIWTRNLNSRLPAVSPKPYVLVSPSAASTRVTFFVGNHPIDSQISVGGGFHPSYQHWNTEAVKEVKTSLASAPNPPLIHSLWKALDRGEPASTASRGMGNTLHLQRCCPSSNQIKASHQLIGW